jgi:hypothetical protein
MIISDPTVTGCSAPRLTSIAQRHARWGDFTEDEKAAGVAELQEIASDRSDLLPEAPGIMVGWTEGKGPEYEAWVHAVADLCRLAGADEDLIPGWTEEGRRRQENARRPPFSSGLRPLGPAREPPMIPTGAPRMGGAIKAGCRVRCDHRGRARRSHSAATARQP